MTENEAKQKIVKAMGTRSDLVEIVGIVEDGTASVVRFWHKEKSKYWTSQVRVVGYLAVIPLTGFPQLYKEVLIFRNYIERC